MTLEELRELHAKLVSGQNVEQFRSSNGKTITYGRGDIPRLEQLIAQKTRAAAGGKRSRTRQAITSKGL